ncbi:MAG TPA: histidine kinase [Candidatus Dormibacteraeota bacterium]
MSRRVATSLAAATLVVSVALDIASSVLGLSRGTTVPSVPPVHVADVVNQCSFATLGVLGLAVAYWRPRNWLWGLASITALLSALSYFTSEYAIWAAVRTHPPGPLAGPMAWLSVWVWAPITCTAPLVMLVYPNGHLLSRRWRWVVAVIVASIAFTAIGLSVHPGPIDGQHAPVTNPLGVDSLSGFADAANSAEFYVTPGFGFVGLISLVIRYRRASGDERQQLKWLGLAGVLYAVQVLLTNAYYATGGSDPTLNTVGTVANILSVLAFPLAVGVGVLKYRLFDVDLVISRALVYSALAIFITGVYVGIVVGLGSVVGGRGRPNLGLSIFATAVVALGFQPLRDRLQTLANRLVYGRRATPYQVLAEFTRRVSGEEALDRMAQVLAEGTGSEQAAVYVGERRVAAFPPDANGTVGGETRSVDVFHQGRQLGRLEVRKRRGEQLSPLEEKLLGDLAHQAGLVFSNVGLAADLRARLEELRASRQRLVQAQDEERRRLERNLHDGAQQHLVALKVRLGLAQALAAKDPARLGPVLAELQTEADSTLATMRELAHGIYPPLLADRGLKEALQSHVRGATLPVSIEADGLGRYPQEVEAAVYFCCLEALQNVQKYAQARSASVRLWEDRGLLKFEVADDGVGFDPTATKPGAGLTNLRDRLDALNGDLTIDSRPGRGTRLGGCVRLAPSRGEPVRAEL